MNSNLKFAVVGQISNICVINSRSIVIALVEDKSFGEDEGTFCVSNDSHNLP